jgi:hypothetical protein
MRTARFMMLFGNVIRRKILQMIDLLNMGKDKTILEKCEGK